MDKASLEKKFKAMKLPELKKFLQDRRVSVYSYLKPGLVAIACAVEDMKMPLLFRVTEEEEQLNVRGRLFINDIQFPDPFTVDAVNEFKDCPPFGLFDIFNHLIYHSSYYDKQGLAAYKSYEDYRLYHDGYVESLLTHYHEEAAVHLFVGKVKPAKKEKTKEGKEFYDLWFIFEGKGPNRGSVIDAHCVCLGGRDGGCKHIAAAMYSLDNLLNSRGEDSVTSGPCQWHRKPKPDTTACEVKDLLIVRKNKRCIKDQQGDATTRKKSRTYTLSQYINHDPRMPLDRVPCSPNQLTSIVYSMSQMSKEPVILSVLAKQVHGSGEVQDCGKPKENNEDFQQGIMKQKLISYLQTNEKPSAKSFRENLDFTETERRKVEATTKKQWQCKQWFIHKTGFITASRVKSVYTRQTSVERHKTDVSLLVKSLINEKAEVRKKDLQEDPQNPLD